MNEITVQEQDRTWESAVGYPQGVMWKVLRRDRQDNPVTVLLRLPAGFDMDGHTHVVVEHHYVLEGEYESMDRRFPADSYRMIPAHTDHGPFRSESGALVLVIWEL